MLSSITCMPQRDDRQQAAAAAAAAAPRRRRLRQQEPIVCDEISQHGLGGTYTAGPTADKDIRQSCERTASATTTTGTTTTTGARTNASSESKRSATCDDANTNTNADTTNNVGPSQSAETTSTTTGTDTTGTTATASGLGIIRAEPQLPSCCVTLPKQSCMIVKSFDESVHSLGLSHHRPSGKSTCTCKGQQHHTHACTKHGLRDTGVGSTTTRSMSAMTADLTHNTCNTNSMDDDDDLSVSFSTIEVREFPVVIGDNPSCAMGPPLSIDWDPDCELSIDIEEFEHYRNGQGYDCCRRRKGDELRLDPEQRKCLVLNAGSSNHDIANAVRQVGRDRRARRRSTHNNLSKPFYAFDVVKESATRKLKRFVLGQKKDSALYDEYMRACMHKESRRRELASMTILEEEAAGEAAELPCASNAAAIVIEEDSTHRGSRNFYDGANRGRCASSAQ